MEEAVVVREVGVKVNGEDTPFRGAVEGRHLCSVRLMLVDYVATVAGG